MFCIYQIKTYLIKIKCFKGLKERPLGACCRVGGQYKECGYEGVGCCPNPSEYVNWDGYHLTQATHQKMAHGLQ